MLAKLVSWLLDMDCSERMPPHVVTTAGLPV